MKVELLRGFRRWCAVSILLVLPWSLSGCSGKPDAASAGLSQQALVYQPDASIDATPIPFEGWLDGSGVAPTLMLDGTAPSGQPVMQVMRNTAGGDYFSPWTAVTEGNTYCVSANIRWVGGSIPFVGIDTTGLVDWLMGSAYTDPVFGATTVVSATASGWQSLSREIVMPAGATQSRLSVELWNGQTKAGPDEAYFDDVQIASGSCAGSAPPGSWLDGNGVAATLVADGTAPSGQPVMQVTRNAAGGDYFSPWTAVTEGNRYCVSANIRWVGGSIPFVGIDTTGTWVDWLIGAAYTDPVFGPTTLVSATASGWQSLSREIVMPAGATQARLSVELWNGETKAGPDEAYFDDVHIAAGSCWRDGSGVAVTLVTDGTAPSGQPVMQVTRNSAGGDYFSPWTAVAEGNTYCVSANIRWVGGSIPFVGIDTTGTWVDWLMGAAYTDPLFGTTTVVSATASGWQSLSRQIVMPAGTTQARLSVELWNGETKAGADEAYFDDVHIASGGCAGSAPPGSWLDRSGLAATLVTDGTAPSGQPVMQVTRNTTGGDYFSPWTAVTEGNTYCVSANIRWVGGSIPFVGIDTTGSWVDWLMGAEYTDPVFGPTTLVSATANGWQSLSREIVMPTGATQARLSVELWNGQTKAGADEAYFDNVHIAAGSCSAIPGPDAGIDVGAAEAGPAQTSCYAWVRRLQDACPEHDTFLGYAACTTADGWLHAGEQRHWEIDATATRPPADVSPPDPNATPADCSGLPALQGNAGLPSASPYYCEAPTASCQVLANSDMGKTLGGSGSPPGAWTLIGGGTTGEGFMSVSVDQINVGNWTYVILSRIGVVYSDAGVPIDWPTPQVAVVYWNGFVRLKTWVAPGAPDYSYGTSVVLGPFSPVDQDPSMVANPDLHPRIGSITFDSTSLAQGIPAAVATGGWYSGASQGAATKVVDSTWHLSWLAPTASATQMHVHIDTNVASDFALPNGRLGVGSLSSMWASSQAHDSDTYSIGPLGGPALAAGAASTLTVDQDTVPVIIGTSDLLSLTTTTSTTHNSGSPDLSLRIPVTPWSN